MRTTIIHEVCAAAALAAAVLTTVIPFPAASAQTTAIEVKIDNFAFAPQRLTVKAGTTVTWINDDDIPHTVASSTKAFKSKALDTIRSRSRHLVTTSTSAPCIRT
jgi:plastocyanin